MRALVQRATGARVTVAGEGAAGEGDGARSVVGEIGPGLVVLVCAMRGDGEAEAARLARKVAALRIFRDADGRMNRSIVDAGGAALVVSQFTLAAETRGNRPGFATAAPPEEGRRLFDRFAALLAAAGVPVATGVFGAEMQVALVNDGPATIWLDTDAF